MLEYDRIDFSEGIDINKNKDTSRECNSCKFYQTKLYDGCHDMSMEAISMQSMAINGHYLSKKKCLSC